MRDFAGGKQGELVHVVEHEQRARLLDGRERVRGRMAFGMGRKLFAQQGDAGEGGALEVGEHGFRGAAEVERWASESASGSVR